MSQVHVLPLQTGASLVTIVSSCFQHCSCQRISVQECQLNLANPIQVIQPIHMNRNYMMFVEMKWNILTLETLLNSFSLKNQTHLLQKGLYLSNPNTCCFCYAGCDWTLCSHHPCKAEVVQNPVCVIGQVPKHRPGRQKNPGRNGMTVVMFECELLTWYSTLNLRHSDIHVEWF